MSTPGSFGRDSFDPESAGGFLGASGNSRPGPSDPVFELERFINTNTNQTLSLPLHYNRAVTRAGAIIPAEVEDVTSRFVTDLAQRYSVDYAFANDPSQDFRGLDPEEFGLFETLEELRRRLSIALFPDASILNILPEDSSDAIAFLSLSPHFGAMDPGELFRYLSSGDESDRLRIATKFLLVTGINPVKQQRLKAAPPLRDNQDLIDQDRLLIGVAGKVLQNRQDIDSSIGLDFPTQDEA